LAILVASLDLVASCRGCGADVPGAATTPTDAAEGAAPAPSQVPYLPARSAPDDSPAPESLVESVLFRQRRRLNECYRTAAMDRPTLQGDAIFQLTIEPSGGVKNVALVSQTGLDVGLIGCATRVLKEASFPPNDAGGPSVLNVPLKFRPPPGGFDAGR
jgi:hypothetical protein